MSSVLLLAGWDTDNGASTSWILVYFGWAISKSVCFRFVDECIEDYLQGGFCP